MRYHLAPKPSVIGERAKFHRRVHSETETIAQYVAELPKLSQKCEFGDFLDEALRDRFVSTLHRGHIQRFLFTEDKKMTFTKAVERALSLVAASKNAKETHSAQERGSELNRVQIKRQPPADAPKNCYRCRSNTHSQQACPFINSVRYQCRRRGHIQRACTADKKPKARSKGQTLSTLSFVECCQKGNGKVADCCGKRPITATMNVEGVPLVMEVDTGASVSVISESQYNRLFSSLNLRQTSLLLSTHTCEPASPVDAVNVKVHHNAQLHQLPLYVLKGQGPPLLGRESLRSIKLDWQTICQLNRQDEVVNLASQQLPSSRRQRLDTLLAKHEEVFNEALDTTEGERAHLVLKPVFRPKFVKARTVPSSLKPAIEQELEKLEKLGIISPTSSTEFATPIVPVLKRDGSVRICGEYTTTLNPMVGMDRYSLPRIDELFAALTGGKHFSKMDLNRAYQVPIAEESARYLTLSTHKVLTSVNRLPFGITTASSIFQRIMDTVLKGLKGVTCYLDDLLVTGSTDEEHFANLEAALKRLSERGICAKKEKCEFFKEQLHYFGHVISADGIHTSPEKVRAIVEAPCPKTRKS